MGEPTIVCHGRAADDGDPICDDFACRTWACWCEKAPQPVCEHGNHPADCEGCEETNRVILAEDLRRARGDFDG